MRSRRTWCRRTAPATSTATAVLALLALVACTSGHQPRAQTVYDGAWEALPTPPLSPRQGAIAGWTGTEAVFLGGDPNAPCPPNASCKGPIKYLNDGAAYNPRTNTWRSTAPAPIPLAPFDRPVVIGDQLFLLGRDNLVRYDASDDAWSEEPLPPGTRTGWHLHAAGSRVVALRGAQRDQYYRDQIYDIALRKWSALPRDPLVPSFDREITWTPVGLVLTGKEEVDQPGAGSNPSLVRAAVLDETTGSWRTLPVSEQLGGWQWTWTGARMVDPTLGGADGGNNDYGRWIPHGGRLDPAAGRWERLPKAPDELTGGWSLYAVSGRRIATAGWFYDDEHGAWTKIPRPEGAVPRPGSAVWTDSALIVFGGADTERGGYTRKALTNAAWAYR